MGFQNDLIQLAGTLSQSNRLKILMDTLISFPKVTICMNGMHSRSKIEQYYPGMKEYLLRQIYTGTLAIIYLL